VGCTACTGPQCLYKDALYPYLLPYKVRLPHKGYSRVSNILNIDVEIVPSMVIHFDTIFYEILWLVPILTSEPAFLTLLLLRRSLSAQSNSEFQKVRVLLTCCIDWNCHLSHLVSFKHSCIFCVFWVYFLFSVQIFHKSQEPDRYFVLKMDSSILGSFIRDKHQSCAVLWVSLFKHNVTKALS